MNDPIADLKEKAKATWALVEALEHDFIQAVAPYMHENLIRQDYLLTTAGCRYLCVAYIIENPEFH